MREAVVVLGVLLASGPAASQEPSAHQRQQLPRWALAALDAPAFATVHRLSAHLDPFLLRGDFDGNGQQDVAVLVSRRDSGAQGIAFLLAGSERIVVVGAGHELGNGGDDFAWMDAWSVVPRAEGPPTLRGDAVLVEKREAASALVYWDGAAYRWLQQGD